MVVCVCKCRVMLLSYVHESQLQKKARLSCDTQILSAKVLITATACFIKCHMDLK